MARRPRLETVFGRLARKKGWAAFTVGIAPLLVRALLLPVMPAPVPRTHDEFSYLLAADTFAHGRLANPEHPFAMHFESMHILVRPMYVSVYPVAQGLLLAAGQVFFGHPWLGVWLSVGLMSASLCWMLQEWLPPGWAFFGGLLFALRLGIFSYWMNSYWGGAVAACGGMLVLGALPRMLQSRKRMPAVWMGLGLAILANSRPFEGLVFALLVFGIGCWKANRLPSVWPTVLILAVAAAGMSYYFQRTTGNPFQMPYVLYRANTSAPHFVWQSPRPTPVFHHAELRRFDDWELAGYQAARAETMFNRTLERAQTYWRFYLGALFTIPLVALPWLWKDRDARLLAAAAALFFLIALSTQVWQSPHYGSPATGLFALLVTMGMRRLYFWHWRGLAIGRVLVRVFPIVLAVALVMNTDARITDQAGSRWTTWGGQASPRASMLERLKKSGDHHLVLVRYAPAHDVNDEWVYNDAGIDASPVVWAREMGPPRDGELLLYFQGRRVWLAEPDATPPRISPYPVETVAEPTALKAAVRKAASDACGAKPCRWTCDQWNYFLTQTTGQAAPNVDTGCLISNDRASEVSFDRWFEWLQGAHPAHADREHDSQ